MRARFRRTWGSRTRRPGADVDVRPQVSGGAASVLVFVLLGREFCHYGQVFKRGDVAGDGV